MKSLLYSLLLLCCGIAQTSNAAGLCPPTHKDLEWAATCFESSDAGRRVKPQYLRNIKVGKSGVATILIEEPRELLAVDRRGRVVIPNIYHAGDFDFPTASGNRGRFAIASRAADGGTVFKCGYFDAITFKIVIPALYDQCSTFQRGQARVCTQCERHCTDDDCHNSVFVGGTGITLDRNNKVLHSAPLAPGAPTRRIP